MRGPIALVGYILLGLSRLALAQEQQPGTTQVPAGPQYQMGTSPIYQFPPLSHAESPNQADPPLDSQVKAPQVASQPQLLVPADAGARSPLMDDAMFPSPGTVVVPKTEPPPKVWEGGVELGLNGSEGNSQNFNLHFGAKLKRKTELTVLSSELDYKKNSADSIETAHKAFLDSRFEYLFQDSPWTWFVHNIVDYDEFKAYDLRISIDTGFGYQFIKNDATSLIGRIGGGTTREIGGPDDKFIPEMVFGLEGEHKISRRQKISASVEYRPDVTDFADYRLNTKAAWEVLLDEEMHLSMKVGVLDRYDSYSDGKKPNDLDYTLTLLWSF